MNVKFRPLLTNLSCSNMVGLILIRLYLFYSVAVYGSDYYDTTSDAETDNTRDRDVVGPRFEGDMLGFNNIQDILNGNEHELEVQEMALIDESTKWAGAIVNYKISKDFPCKEKCIILEAMHEMEMKTCLKFVENNGRDGYIDIKRQGLCASYVGRQGNRQQLYLSSSCASKVGVVIHELMHAIGFLHEISRKDRNDYIEVVFSNIAEIHEIHFRNHGFGNTTTYGLPYDYDSIMHHGQFDFSNNGGMTIRPRTNRIIGQRERMSELDIKKINTHYKCTTGEFGCLDRELPTICRDPDQGDPKKACRVHSFKEKCKKTCGYCSNHTRSDYFSNIDSCRTAAQRCEKWQTNLRCDDANFETVIRSHCYQSCTQCNSYGFISESEESAENLEDRVELTFESDILGFNNVEDIIHGNQDPDTQDNALDDETKKWPDAIVYYKLSKRFSCKEKCIIHEAMQEMELNTCVKFIAINDHGDYIDIRPSVRQCASYVGRQGNVQEVFLTPSCAIQKGMVIHELMHAIGFFHEQSRKDRNDYVEVIFENIAEIDHINFENHGLGKTTTYGMPYDFESVMHYGHHDFSKNGQMTVRGRNNETFGQREKMSRLDIEKVKQHFKCTASQFGCLDREPPTTCRKGDLKRACRNHNFKEKCKKTCGYCSNQTSSDSFSSTDSCRTAAQRCEKWRTNLRCDDANFETVIRSHCYQSCTECNL